MQGAGDNGIFIGGNCNIIENCETRNNRNTGIQLFRYDSSLTSIADWPSHNLILNCYSHDNYDTDNGEDADGFAAKLTSGAGNIFRGCIAACNVDDGWDLFTKDDTGPIGASALEDCIAYNNGPSGDYNFNFDAGSYILTNNLSYLGGGSDHVAGATDAQGTNVLWINDKTTNAKGLACSATDFVSLTPSVNRNADSSPNLGNFLALATGSDLIGAGIPSSTNIGAR